MFFKKKNTQEVWIIAGLGNPGPEYEDTRHNCGFLSVDKLSEKLNISLNKKKFKAYYGEGKADINGKEVKIVLLKPFTYMNNSGESIEQAVNWYKTDSAHLIVIYDDIDLEPGAIRVRPKGSAGSHNGMKSIIKYLADEGFPRVRVGIGKKPERMDLASYVLSHFSEDDMKIMGKSFAAAADASWCIINKGAERAMSEYNGKKF
ncbi:MAG: aminoacyl-tRNA hydrolase [Ruminococcaceae bacterium]|nr:aminoacyl-tRNA hydrolase [Oscillospiraceae bacterium]